MPGRNYKALLDAASMILDLSTGAYPPFVYGGGCGCIPVFCFHGVEPESFERQLRFLADNGYRTLTTDDLADPGNRSVMLTFDDGWGSLWSVGMPLLKKYGIKAVVFLAAARIHPSGIGLNLNESSEVVGRDSSDTPFLTWDEIAKMHESGLVDFQSHTLTHSKVFCSPRIVDFVHPSMRKDYTIFQVPEWDGTNPRLGRPIYESSPRMGKCRRYIEANETRRSCERYVEKHGEEQFFAHPGWRAELTDYAGSLGIKGGYETDDERRGAILRELIESKRLIEEHLPGKEVRHLCYPWHCYSRLAVELSHEAGYTTNFAGKVSHRYIGIHKGKPTMIARVGDDFFFRLPGKGRVSLASILLKKADRRTASG